MFVLDELDKILESIGLGEGKRTASNKVQISLPDIKRFDVKSLKLETQVRYSESFGRVDSLIEHANRPTNYRDLEMYLASINPPTIDCLFSSLMSSMVLSKFTQLPERQYPSARLVICDSYSYDLMVKLKHISSRWAFVRSGGSRNFIFRDPFSVTAIFLVSDLLDVFKRERAPLVLTHRDLVTGKPVANYNYGLIRRLFPYLKMSDLFILLNNEQSQLVLGNFSLDLPYERQMLLMLNHFARSTQLVDLSPIEKLIGRSHPIHDNVLALVSNDTKATSPADQDKALATGASFQPLKLAHLSLMSDRLVRLSEKLRFYISSVSFRSGDPSAQTKAFAQMLSAAVGGTEAVSSAHSSRSARVLVLDRSFDLVGALTHADRYGAFLEQERQAGLSNVRLAKLRMDSVDDLDEQLQLDHLTDALGTILKYTAKLSQPKDSSGLTKSPAPKVSESVTSSIPTSLAIRRHLDIVKVVYKCLHEGYLLMLRLESTLVTVSDQVRGLSEPMKEEQQQQTAECLSRVLNALKQLLETSGTSIGATDLVRVVCILLDVVNIVQLVHSKESKSASAQKILDEIKEYVLTGKDMKKAIKSKLDPDSDGDVLAKIGAFDRMSLKTCSQRSTLSLEQIVELFIKNQLDREVFPSLRTSEETQARDSGEQVSLVVLLGPITPNELSRVKALEDSLVQSKTVSPNRLLLFTYEIASPDSFLKAL